MNDMTSTLRLLRFDTAEARLQHSSEEKRIDSFFERTIRSTSRRPTNLIVVSHAIRSLPPFLRALSSVHHVKGLFIKPKSYDQRILAKLSCEYRTRILSREMFERQAEATSILEEYAGNDAVVLADIGGYFANVPRWQQERGLGNVLGIVEDTENGHQRYLRSAGGQIPVISVARSASKRMEDWWVGRAIAFSGERQLRSVGETFGSKRALVIGFGKIGSSIADALKRHGCAVSVYDENPCIRVFAESQSYYIPDRQEAIDSADIIFCATGNKALSLDDLAGRTRPLFIFSATSADDEFDIDFSGARRADAEFWTASADPGHASILFANRGNAVNFIDGGEIGRYAHMVQAAIVHGIDSILCGDVEPGGIAELSDWRERAVSAAYIGTFA